MQIKTQGLIIKEQTIGESDRLVTVLTRDNGVLRAFARRAKNLKDSKSAATQLLCYSRLSVFKGRDKYIIDERRADRGLFRASPGHRRAFARAVFLRARLSAGARGDGLRGVPAARAELAALPREGHAARSGFCSR